MIDHDEHREMGQIMMKLFILLLFLHIFLQCNALERKTYHVCVGGCMTTESCV